MATKDLALLLQGPREIQVWMVAHTGQSRVAMGTAPETPEQVSLPTTPKVSKARDGSHPRKGVCLCVCVVMVGRPLATQCDLHLDVCCVCVCTLVVGRLLPT